MPYALIVLKHMRLPHLLVQLHGRYAAHVGVPVQIIAQRCHTVIEQYYVIVQETQVPTRGHIGSRHISCPKARVLSALHQPKVLRQGRMLQLLAVVGTAPVVHDNNLSSRFGNITNYRLYTL